MSNRKFPCPCGGELAIYDPRPFTRYGRPYVRRRRVWRTCEREYTSYEFIVEEGEVVIASRTQKKIRVMLIAEWFKDLDAAYKKLFGYIGFSR